VVGVAACVARDRVKREKRRDGTARNITIKQVKDKIMREGAFNSCPDAGDKITLDKD
jgi:hypothetical protein